MRLSTILKLSKNSILGLNKRNQLYIRPYNTSTAKNNADDKILCKKMLNKVGISTTSTYKVIYSKEQLKLILWDNLPKSFVIKPNKGTGGNGIIVFWGKRKGILEWIKSNGQVLDVAQIKTHISDILDGRYSMGSKKDIAILEERVINNDLMKTYSYRGIPDIRIIVFNMVPVMAMLRFPTKRSNGKANVHAGAIATGIDIATGITTTSIINKKFSLIPYTQDSIDKMVDKPYLSLRGIKIPYWKKILRIAINSQLVSGLGYTGVDIALDKNKGPVVFELNARPGLAIQIANQKGLAERLQRVEGLKIKTIEQGLETARTLFGGEVQDEIESISGKQIIAPFETIKLIGLEKPTKTKKLKKETTKTLKQRVRARIDTGEYYSFLDRKVAFNLGFAPVIIDFEEANSKTKDEATTSAQKLVQKWKAQFIDISFEIIKKSESYKTFPLIPIRTLIDEIDKKINYKIRDRTRLSYPAVIGRKDLKEFLVDPGKQITLK